MSEEVKIQGSLLIKNTALNFIGQIIPLLVALATIPYIIHGLGVERFGILSLAWVVLGYFNLFDLGLGRATTKFVAEALGKGETRQISPIIWTSLVFIIAFSLIGVVTLMILTPMLVEHLFNIPPDLVKQAKLVFYIVSAGILIALVTATLSGVLEAYQRFDLVNILRAPSSILSSIISVIVISYGGGLTIIVSLLVFKDFMILFLYLFSCLRVMPATRPSLSIDFKLGALLFNFGGWIALHNAAVMILLYLDRFLVGVFLTLSAVTYYTAPYELINRTLIIPSSLMTVLFPAFSSLQKMNQEKLQSLFIRTLKYLILIMGFIIGVMFVFSKEILVLWLGSDFEKSAYVLQLLAIGVFLSSLAWLTGTLLQGVGRPKVVTIIHIAQVPIYIFSTWLLIRTSGIEGAALSWTLRILLSLGLLLWYCWKVNLFKPILLLQNGSIKLAAVLCTISTVTIAIKSLIPFTLINTSLIFLVFMTLTSIILWKYTLDQEDRAFIRRSVNGLNLAK